VPPRRPLPVASGVGTRSGRPGAPDRALPPHLPRRHHPYRGIRCECPIHAAPATLGSTGHPRRMKAGAAAQTDRLTWWPYFPASGPGRRPGAPRRYVSPGPRVRDDLVAQVDAFNADRHAGNGDQHVGLRLRLTAETACRVVAIHRRFPFIATWHYCQRTGGPQQPRPRNDRARALGRKGCAAGELVRVRPTGTYEGEAAR
jgi:hypothetical protein